MPVYEERIWLHADKRLCFLQNNSDAPKTLVAPHWHEGYEILYIRRGWGEQRINAQILPFHLGEISSSARAISTPPRRLRPRAARSTSCTARRIFWTLTKASGPR